MGSFRDRRDDPLTYHKTWFCFSKIWFFAIPKVNRLFALKILQFSAYTRGKVENANFFKNLENTTLANWNGPVVKTLVPYAFFGSGRRFLCKNTPKNALFHMTKLNYFFVLSYEKNANNSRSVEFCNRRSLKERSLSWSSIFPCRFRFFLLFAEGKTKK
jgi:hypothetical protein